MGSLADDGARVARRRRSLHVLYAEPDKTLAGVGAFLANPDRTQGDTLKHMLRTNHRPSGPHSVVAQVARSMLNKADNELSGVISQSGHELYLDLFRDPLIARSTSTSDFRIADLMNLDHPVSLYLVVPPSDLSRLRRLSPARAEPGGAAPHRAHGVRHGSGWRGRNRRSCRDASHAVLADPVDGRERGRDAEDQQGLRKHKLLLLIDEFTSLGKLDFFESQLAFCAGYGLKCFMVAQSLNQLQKTYGDKNSILDNSHIRVTYAANDEITAKRISDLVGQATLTKRQKSFSAAKFLSGRSVSESEQEFARPLLTADEVLRLPFDEAILLVSGMAPYRAKKLMYYLDPRFKRPRQELPPPNSPREQQAQLPKRAGPVSGGRRSSPVSLPAAAADAAGSYSRIPGQRAMSAPGLGEQGDRPR